MCNLYSSRAPRELATQIFEVTDVHSSIGNMRPQSAVFPGYSAPIVAIGKTGDRSLVMSQWGFMTPKKSARTGAWLKPSIWNNTRDDKLRSSNLWRSSFETRRCLIPVTAYAETTGRNPATYHWFGIRETEVFAFAGIWKYQKETVGKTPIDSVVHSMVTTNANDFVSSYHHRMPVVVSPNHFETWLSGSAVDAFDVIEPFPSAEMVLLGEGVGLKQWPVGTDN